MKCNIGICFATSAHRDLDKQLILLSELNKNLKISKKVIFPGNDYECLVINELVDNLHIVQIKDKNYKIKVKLDFYLFKPLSYTLADLEFEIPDNIVQGFSIPDAMMKIKVNFNDQEQSLIGFIIPILMNKIGMSGKIDMVKNKFLDSDLSVYDKQDQLFNETGFKYFLYTNEIAFNVNNSPAYLLFHDYDKKIDVTKMEKIDNGDSIFLDWNSGSVIQNCSDNSKDVFAHLVIRSMSGRIVEMMQGLCRAWLESLKNISLDVSKNIENGNKNAYYWKEFKKSIELIDLNFLPIHSYTVSICSKLEAYQGFTVRLNKKYHENYEKRLKKSFDVTLKLIDEVKYAINNVRTPGQSYNDTILQVETEKVNERIMLISFIAMALPCAYALSSETISIFIKLLFAIGIISIPFFYFLINTIKKKLAIRRNFKIEKRRLYSLAIKSLADMKSEMEVGNKLNYLPKDLINQIHDMMKSEIKVKEKQIEKLKKQI